MAGTNVPQVFKCCSHPAGGSSGFGSRSTAKEVAAKWDGTGKVMVITGAAGGLGAEATRVLAGRGATVVLLVRNLAAAENIKKEILVMQPTCDIRVIKCELDSLASVAKAAQEFIDMKLPLHVLMLNAGVMAPKELMHTQDGLELQIGVNHVAHFLLTRMLLPTMIKTASAPSASQGRIVVLSSSGHYMAPREYGLDVWTEVNQNTYRALSQYGQSKLANILFTRELATRLSGAGVYCVDVVVCHPGIVPQTGLPRYLGVPGPLLKLSQVLCSPFVKTPEQGAATQVYLATAKRVLPGEYYIDCNVGPSWHHAHNAILGRKLWDWTEETLASHISAHTKVTPAPGWVTLPAAAKVTQTTPHTHTMESAGSSPSAKSLALNAIRAPEPAGDNMSHA